MGALTEQDQSIKDRKKLLFDDDPAAAFDPNRKPFAIHLRETPPLPVSAGVKGMLWAAAVVVGLLLIAAVYTVVQPKAKTPKDEPAKSRASR